MVARRYDVPVTTVRSSWIQHPGGYECTGSDGADENYVGRPTRELFQDTYGTVPSPCTFEGDASALANDRARELFGWTPALSVRDDADYTVEPTDDW